MIQGGNRDPNVWYCNDNEGDNSRTWSSAQWFYWFLDRSPRTTALDDPDDLCLGDIVMLQGPDFSHPDHAMIVTYIPRSNEFFLAEKTTHGGRVG
jgi:hypothetical protein